ncbi:phosphoribosylaminoimidazolesuccinocarboxamide synthase [candidate division KSB1 bacterium]|nr:phosphoribosylaminoimidazolesuccinocarboxamide synthase [candidate division KSB1 bacterium]
MLKPVLNTNIEGAKPPRRGKVRDIYNFGDRLLIVVTDRVSAFDVIMPNGIPDKGKILNQISAFWFDRTTGIIPNHKISIEIDDFPEVCRQHRDMLIGRSMLVECAEPLPVECIVRGYLAGSGWKDYQNTGAVSGIELPQGLPEYSRLDKPIFTPSTKAESGHDENITIQQMENLVGKDIARKAIESSLAIYKWGRKFAEKKGIIIADTKFEFGLQHGELVLIDEALTPDSSRFWPMDSYQPGISPKSFDKQFVRDYLQTLDWDKTPPAPALPEDVVLNTRKKYIEAYERLTGQIFQS